MSDFLIEAKLKKEAPKYHNSVKDSVVVLERMLQSFLAIFPTFTDHTILHSMDVLDFCNQIIGEKQVERLTPIDCYVIVMASYLHDIGMGVRDKDYEEFCERIDFGDYFETHKDPERADVIRDFHNEFSGLFIEKFADVFDIPSEETKHAIIQVSRGHRVTDLYDEEEYRDIATPDGIIHTPYLAAVIRLADEVDVGSERNPEILYDTAHLTRQRDIEAFGTHNAIRKVEVAPNEIILHVHTDNEEYKRLIEKLAGKVQKTLDYCRDVAEKRSDFSIDQERVRIDYK
ncbi:MAG: hypothetical protein J6N76_09640 [Lachnospiraceae bacterium]|nr:hypothetical protein [Lachnospiraceae bacterium]